MALKTEVIDAFNVLGIPPDSDEATASRAYKKLALLHHPDRNHGDSTSTARFQQIGAAWSICTHHFENPGWSQARPAGSHFWSHHGPHCDSDLEDDDDDDLPMDEEESREFFRFMFFQMFMDGGYTRSKGQRFRSQRSGGFGSGFHSFYSFPSTSSYQHSDSYSYSESYSDTPRYRQSQTASQKKEKERYEQRMRDFEKEVEAEERELERIEREKKLAAEKRVSAQAQAFELARAGKSSDVRGIIKKFDLDVNAPERPLKGRKQHQSSNSETILHVAASHCDQDLISFLLGKGASTMALNRDNLTPFHCSVLCGNTHVARFFLDCRGKGSEGCHPSKAAADGRTPLQLAIASGSVSTVELMLKDATVHDVEKSWEQPSLSTDIKHVLKTKKGFVPRDNAAAGPPMSRKALLKAEAARKQAALLEEKAKRIAEERARAAENLRKKEERAVKRALEEAAKEEARKKLEAEERARVEEACWKEEQERRRVELEELQRTEEEARRKEQKEALRKQEEERRRAREEALRNEQEERRRAELEARRQEEREALLKAEQETRRAKQEARRKAEEARRWAEQEERRKVLEKESRQRIERETRQREAEARQKQAETRRKAEEEARLRKDEELRQAEEYRRKQALQAQEAQEAAEAKRAEGLRRLKAQAEEHERQRRLREQGATPAAVSTRPSLPPVDSREETMRKRAEQSVRDKARNQRLKEEKARLNAEKLAEASATPPSNFAVPHIPDNLKAESAIKKRKPHAKKANKLVNPNAPPRSIPSYPLTPSSLSSSPLSWSAEASYNPNTKASFQVDAPLSPPMTPENLQTCAIPDDLFSYERPIIQSVDDRLEPSISSSIVNSHNSQQDASSSFATRGRGWRGRGRGRGRGGGSAPWQEFSDVQGSASRGRRRGGRRPALDGEQELARKNLEIERLSAELTALRAGAP